MTTNRNQNRDHQNKSPNHADTAPNTPPAPPTAMTLDLSRPYDRAAHEANLAWQDACNSGRTLVLFNAANGSYAGSTNLDPALSAWLRT